MRISLITIAITCLILIAGGCLDTTEENDDDLPSMDFRQDMRNLVMNISRYSRSTDPDFILIPQNGQELLTTNGNAQGPLAVDYIDSIDGVGREDLFYGYNRDDEATPDSETDHMTAYLDLALSRGLQVLVTDYCSTESNMEDSLSSNMERGYISFAADRRDLDNIPLYPDDPHHAHSGNVTSLSMAQNFLYLLDPGSFDSREDYLDQIRRTDFDILLIDAFFGDELLSAGEVNSLKTKENGGTRLVISYMSIGEAEDYRYYWQYVWKSDPPEWMEGENPDWDGNYKVRYWDPSWQEIIFGSEDSYLDMILKAGFDGVYLDIIDAFEYFE